MLDRSQRFGIAVSLGLHALVAGAFTVVSSLAPSRAASSRPLETVIVQIRLDGPETRVVENALHSSGAEEARGVESARALPAVSAPPARRFEANPAAPKSSPEPVLDPEQTPAPAPARVPAEGPAMEPPEPARETPRDPSAHPRTAVAPRNDGPAPVRDVDTEATEAAGGGSAIAEEDAPGNGSNAVGRPGRATGGADEEDDPFARYIESVRTRVQARRHYPPLARKRSVEGRVVARVAIRADGRIQAIDFDQGAQPLLRRATDEAIRAAEPYPAPPAGAVTIELPIDYSLRDTS